MTPQLSVIIVSFNTAALTCQTLASVFADIEASNLAKKVDVWLVDNASTDDTLARVKKQFPHQPLTIISNKTNAGFAVANNLAIRQSQGDVVFLLNSDTVVQPGALIALIAAFAQPSQPATAWQADTKRLDNVGIIATSLWNPDGTPQWQGGALPTLWTLTGHWLMFDDVPFLNAIIPSTQHTGLNIQRVRQATTENPEQLLPMEWVGGTAMAIRRQVIDEIGLLDEQIFMYGEDMEFCLRAADHHWDVALLPAAKITHYGSASSSSAHAILGEIKGYVYIWAKHKPVWQSAIVRGILSIGCLQRMLVFTLTGNRQKVAIYHQALASVLR